MKTKATLLFTLPLAMSAAISVLAPSQAAAQGSLTPTAAPGPVMKTLSQIEPRTDIMTLPGDFNDLHIITNSGSYYLTTNLMMTTGAAGISIRANNVTLDLNGFTVSGSPATGFCIDTPNYITNVVICNGMVTGGPYDINGNQIYFGRYEKLIIAKSVYIGLACGRSSVIQDCIFSTNAIVAALSQGNNIMKDCEYYQNGIALHSAGAGDRIEGNQFEQNGYGLLVDSSGNLIYHNFASNNTTNYSIVANNKVGVIVSPPTSTAVSGSTGGAGLGTTDPWANFSF